MLYRLSAKIKSRSTVVIMGTAVSCLIIGIAAGLYFSGHDKKSPTAAISHVTSPPAVAGVSVEKPSSETVLTASSNGTTTSPKPAGSTSTSTTTPKTTSTSPAAQQVATTAKTNPTPDPDPQPQPNPDPQPDPSISFSSDGCYVTVNNAAGLILKGDVTDSAVDPHKGGPMGNPDGYVIDSSGYIRVGIGAGIGTDFNLHAVTAVLTDTSGSIVLQKLGTITSPSCPE